MFQLYNKIKNGDVYVICEMSANHGGSLDNALAIVRKAKEVGADCLKIQTYTADTITIDCHKDIFKCGDGLWDGQYLYDLYKKAYTPWEWQPIIKEECERQGIDFLSTPFDQTAVDFLEEIGTEAYKIASFEVVDIPLIEYTASKGKPMIISTGMASVEEIDEAVAACRRNQNDKIILLKCCSEYPSKWKDMHLSNIPEMKKRYKCPIGLSDHSSGSMGAVVAVSLGACVVEKHMMLDGIRSEDTGFSMLPDDFSKMIKDINTAKQVIGNVYFGPNESEDYNCRRSLYAVKNIKKGDRFSTENVKSIRPSGGLLPRYYNEIIGKISKRDIEFGEPIIEKDL